MTAPTWDPQQYLRYADERSRPVIELLARVGAAQPREVVDLGCGPGHTMTFFSQRWPTAHLLGVDSSASMIDQAHKLAVPGHIEFQLGRLEEWTSDRPVDVLFSNAALHWVPDHPRLFPRWVEGLAPGGWLAFQVPGNFTSPSHEALHVLAGSSRWRAQLADLIRHQPVLEPAAYLAVLQSLGCQVDAWETTYLHVLTGPDPVVEWTRGTALRPFLDRLNPEDADEFVGQYREALRAAYPPTADGITLFPFRRLFVVAQKP
jgi:trans-aconitate 2-methyltransferase